MSGGSEQGLLSLAFDPHYATNGRFYVFYTNRAGDIRVVRYVVSSGDPNVANAGSAKVLLKVAHHAHPNHNGGQLAFGPDGRLYIGIGDGGSEGDPNNYGQNTKRPLRQDLAPERHLARRQARPLRLRPAQPLALLVRLGDRQPLDRRRRSEQLGGDRLSEGRHEARHQLRLELLRGRPLSSSRSTSCARDSSFPVTEYSHSLGCAVIGGYVYRGSAIPALRGDYLFADYCSGRVWFKTGPHAARRILTGISQKLTNVTLVRAGRERRALPVEPEREPLQARAVVQARAVACRSVP